MNPITVETKQIIKLALPLVVAFLAQKGMQIVDTIMMGRIGIDALAAGALGTGVWMAMYVFCMGSMSAVGISIAHLIGAEKKHEISHVLQNGVGIALLFSIPSMLVIWEAPHVLMHFGENKIVIDNMRDFLHALVWGFPGILCFLVLREFVSAFGRLPIVILISFISIPLTAIGNYCLIYGKYGFPVLGIAGIGYACAAVQWLMAISLYSYVMLKPELKVYIKDFRLALFTPSRRPAACPRDPKDLDKCARSMDPANKPRDDGRSRVSHFSLKTMWEIARIGVPSGITFLLDVSTILIAAVLIGRFGSAALAAHQIALQSVSVSYAFPVAISIATGLRVGHALGANNLVLAKKTAYIGLAIGLLISIIISLVFLLFPEVLVKAFIGEQNSSDTQVFVLAKLLLNIATLFLCFDATQAILNGILRGFKDTFFPMWISCVCYWLIGLPIAYYFGIYLNYGTPAIWYGIISGITAVAIVLFLRFLYRLNYEKANLSLPKKLIE